jgi:hypothetical protein
MFECAGGFRNKSHTGTGSDHRDDHLQMVRLVRGVRDEPASAGSYDAEQER